MKRCWLILLAFGSLLPCFAQRSPAVDSLYRALKAARHDTTRAQLFYRLSEDVSVSAADTILLLAGKAFDLTERSLPTATGQVKRSLLKTRADALNNMGYAYIQLGNIPKAVESLQKCYELSRQIGDKASASEALNNIASVYSDQLSNGKALEYYQQSLSLKRELRDTSGIAALLLEIADKLIDAKEYQKAYPMLRESLQLFDKLPGDPGAAYALMEIGKWYSAQGKPSQALPYQLKALAIQEKAGNKDGASGTLVNLGRVYGALGQYPKALHYARRALAVADSIVSVNRTAKAHQLLSELYRQTGNHAAAFQHYEKYIIYLNSLRNGEIQNQLMQYEYREKENKRKAELEKKELIAREEMSRQRLIRNGLMVGAALLLLILVLLWHRFRFVSRTKQIIERQKDVSERLRQESDALLLNILPAETAEELKKYGKARARNHDRITVLFADIKGFTLLAALIPAEQLVSLLDTYFQCFDRVMETHGLEKIKTIGDAYLCAGGLSSTAVSEPADVVRAALEMLEAVDAIKLKRQQSGEPYFELRIGIHTGPVVAGVVGIKKFAYDIWGDTVNTAARMEQTSEPGKVNISGTTFELVKEYFDCTFRGKIQAKNKGEMEMYFVEREYAAQKPLLAAANRIEQVI